MKWEENSRVFAMNICRSRFAHYYFSHHISYSVRLVELKKMIEILDLTLVRSFVLIIGHLISS
jgi:hypothetical protein